MSETTPRLTLPLLQPGQAQKEMVHNEALIALDAMVHAVAEDVIDAPPAADPGMAWIVSETPGGVWAGQAHRLAMWTEAGWRFAAMPEGALAWLRGRGTYARRTQGGWVVGDLALERVSIAGQQVLGKRAGAITAPAGGQIVDAEARTVLVNILNMLRNHGLIERQN